MFLIIGASGFIGNKLYNQFNGQGIDIKGTYYPDEFEGTKEDQIYLDLGLNDPNFSEILKLKGLTHIFYCNGITSIDKCKINYDLSYKINVTNTIKLFENFKRTETIPIFLSSDMVYNGNKKFYNEEEEVCPITEYGKQKVEVEKYIMNNFEKYIILRLTKVIGIKKGDKTLFTSWFDTLVKNKPIYSAVDNYLSLVYAEDVVSAINLLVVGNHNGVFNLGGSEILSRYDWSIKFANFLGLNSSLIHKKFIKDFKFIEPRLAYSSLDSSKIIKTTGIKLTLIEDCFNMMKRNYEASE